MTKQEIANEQKKISHMILESIQEKRDIRQLASLLSQQRRLYSEIREVCEDSVNRT